MPTNDRPWFKLHQRYFLTRSHALLSPEALNTGPTLMSFAAESWDGETEHADIPYGLKLMAHHTRWPVEKMREILAELVEAGTIEHRSGVYRFPNWKHFQGPAKSTERVRKSREKKKAAQSKPDQIPAAKVGQSVSTQARYRFEDISDNERILAEVSYITPPKDCESIGGPTARRHLAALVNAGAGPKDIIRTIADYAKACDLGIADSQWWGVGMLNVTPRAEGRQSRWEGVERDVAKYRAQVARDERVKAELIMAAERKVEEESEAKADREKVGALAAQLAERLGGRR